MDFLDQLIESVRLRHCIYDKSHVDFKNIVAKQKAWEEVAAICGRSSEDCRKKWTMLRERLSKEERKQDGRSGDGNSNEPEWAYYQSMTFLKKFVQPRKTRKNNFDASSETTNDDFFSESDSTDIEVCQPSKKRKLNKFDEACEAVKSAAEQVNAETEEGTSESSGKRALINFMKTVCDLMEPLPQEQQDLAMLAIMQYVTDMRRDWLFSSNSVVSLEQASLK